jgi:DNA-binding response OmpR family regulator
MLKKDEKTAHIPIIFLSAKSKVSDITSGLGLGADDYVAKPFDMKELLARIDVRLRASESSTRGGDVLHLGDLRIDPANRSVRYKNKDIELTLTEFDILRCLAAKPGEVINRKEIIEAVRSNSKKVINDRTIDVHVRSIRKKIPEITKHLSSVYGAGYRYDK